MTSAIGPKIRSRVADVPSARGMGVSPMSVVSVRGRDGRSTRGQDARDTVVSGFTLVELILVMVLTLTMLALAAPRLDGFSRGRVIACQGESLLSLIHAGRDRAGAEAVTYRLELDVKSGVVTLLYQQNGQFVEVSPPSSGRLELAQGIAMECSRIDGDINARIDLMPDGSCTPAKLTLRDGRGNVLYIVCRSPLETFVIQDTDPGTIK